MSFVTWKRFSLRSLFVLMTLSCLTAGGWSAYVNPYRQQAQSLATVAKLQGTWRSTNAAGPPWYRWLVTKLVGDNTFIEVTEVDLARTALDDATLRSLVGLTHVEKLTLDYTPITDDGIAVIHSMPKLQSLSLRYTKISDRTAPLLAALPALNTLSLTGTAITDATAKNLSTESALRELFIPWTKITNDGAAQLAQALPGCHIYHQALTQ
jgi:hypothetical protein